MDVQSNDPQTWLAVAASLFLGLFAWSAKRQVSKQDDHEKRLNELEGKVATRADIASVYERVNELADQSREQYRDLSTRMNDQHAQILQTIIEKVP
jgi:uncharacterized membrane-anchored protein YhcB (DUF1043 family)